MKRDRRGSERKKQREKKEREFNIQKETTERESPFYANLPGICFGKRSAENQHLAFFPFPWSFILFFLYSVSVCLSSLSLRLCLDLNKTNTLTYPPLSSLFFLSLFVSLRIFASGIGRQATMRQRLKSPKRISGENLNLPVHRSLEFLLFCRQYKFENNAANKIERLLKYIYKRECLKPGGSQPGRHKRQRTSELLGTIVVVVWGRNLMFDGTDKPKKKVVNPCSKQ
jgi:hypothetical protein